MLISGLERSSILLAQQDSSALTLQELKQISSLLTEVEFRRAQYATFIDKESVYKSIIEGYQNDQELYKQQIANLNANIEAVKPSWYDNFWTGAAVASVVISSIFFLTK